MHEQTWFAVVLVARVGTGRFCASLADAAHVDFYSGNFARLFGTVSEGVEP